MFAVPWCEHTDHFSCYVYKGQPGCPEKACKLELSTSMLYQ